MDKCKPRDDQILFVEAKTGTERKAIHAWAELYGYQHCAIITDYFSRITRYQCKMCSSCLHEDELYFSPDWSSIYPGEIRGNIIKCSICLEGLYYPDDPECSDIKKKCSYFNAVIIAKELPLLSKREVRKHKKKYPSKKSSQDIKLLDEMEIREIRVMPRGELGLFLKGYPRVRNNS